MYYPNIKEQTVNINNLDSVSCVIEKDGDDFFLTPIHYKIEDEVFEENIYNYMSTVYNAFKFKIKLNKDIVVDMYHDDLKDTFPTYIKKPITSDFVKMFNANKNLFEYDIYTENWYKHLDLSFEYIDNILNLLNLDKESHINFLANYYVKNLLKREHFVVGLIINGKNVLETKDGIVIKLLEDIDFLKVKDYED